MTLNTKYLDCVNGVDLTEISCVFCRRCSADIPGNKQITSQEGEDEKMFSGKESIRSHLSCHNVQAVFKGIPLFSELSSSFSDRLERCGEFLLASTLSSSTFGAQSCKKTFDIIGEALCSTAISRTTSVQPQQITS